MDAIAPLPPESLYKPCDFSTLSFDTTDDLAELAHLPGQDRAREAIEFGVGMVQRGYNLFVLGPPGGGKRTLVTSLLEGRTAAGPIPNDWCYVNNFKQPHRPRALELPAGRAVELRKDMMQLLEDLRAAIPAMFDSEEHRAQAEMIESGFREQQEEGLNELGKEANLNDITLMHTPAGFTLVPTSKGELLSPEEVMKMPEEERARLEQKLEAFQQKLQRIVRHAQQLQKEKRLRIKQLIREMADSTVKIAMDELQSKYATLPDVLIYLNEVHTDVMDHIEDFRHAAEAEGGADVSGEEAPSFRRFEVNVIIGNDRPKSGAPVVFENNPTYQNLLGRVEYVARFGMLVTDFLLIKAGALHHANGGYLVLDARKLLTQPFAWEGLKRTLSSAEIRTESLGQSFGLISTVALEPQPIPINVKVVLLGERMLYYLLLAYDPEFAELFKVAADFEEHIDRTDSQEDEFARLVGNLVRKENLLPFDRSAVARVVEESARWSGDSQRFSANIEELSNLLREAEYAAKGGKALRVGAGHVQAAVEQRHRRSDRIHRRIHEAILRNELFVATQGAAIGQINGLSVSFAGEYAFAFPTRITAATRLGDGDVVDIQREVEMGGPIHSKGVLILAAYLGARYAPDRPLSLRASLVFEQTYGSVEGDSASVAELCVLLSSLGGFALKQSIGVTGSVNQHGFVQPIGGVNEKVEGFFDICKSRGLTGEQGVIIPAANQKHLMLRSDVIEAVRAGRFSVYAIEHVDAALALLSGMPAGEVDENGNFPEDSVNFQVATRLEELSLLRQAYANMTVKIKKIAVAKASKPRETDPRKTR